MGKVTSMPTPSRAKAGGVSRNGGGGFRGQKPRDPGVPKDAIARLVDACGGVGPVQRILGSGKTVTYAWTDQQAPDEISFARVAALEEACRTGIAAAYLAQLAGGIYVPAAPGNAEGALPACLASLGKEIADVFARGAEALADGVCEPHEARALLREVLEANGALGALIAALNEIAYPETEDAG